MTTKPISCRTATLGEWCRANGAPYAELPAAPSPSTSVLSIPGLNGSWKFTYQVPRTFAGIVEHAALHPQSGHVVTRDGSVIYEGLTGADYQAQAATEAVLPLSRAKEGSASDVSATGPWIDREAVYIGGNSNFGHFLFESLLRLPLLKWFGPLAQLPIVVLDSVPSRFL